ncbi:hypothetical protein AN4828.2 [Aspergillus nidulans FGSC A4]|nr:hypothetical protein AN4828.2 [Aspergillus nidulans FGSC A4]|eukprot:XP_662432.1 hypothetical protein AN4828.2 [Aspergillus nidulans FGSC A4]
MAPIAQIEYFRIPPRWLFVKITDANGNYGWGEASLEGHTEAVEGCLDAFAQRFAGMDADDIEHIWQHGYRMGFYRGGPVLMSALSGVDIALWDLKARRLGLPIYQLLGGKVRDKLKVYAWIGGDRPGDVEAQARARISQGFKAVKMNATEDLSWLDSPHALDTSVERLKTVKSLGIDAGVDFHGRVHKAMAQQLAYKLAPHEPLFIEEPLLSEHPESVAALSKLVPIPIALGERLHSRWDIKPFLESASVSILQPDICHVGGISEIRRIATMAEAYDVALAPHCPLGPIALAASLQVDAVSANFAIQEMSLGIHYNAGSADIDTYIKNPEVWKVQDGLIDLLSGPGLGIEIDEEKIRAAAVDAVAWRSPHFVMLPTRGHPNKRRSVKERVRVTRACDTCKKKKLRCSGTLPCFLCQRSQLRCEYTAGYTRGKVPPVPTISGADSMNNTIQNHHEKTTNSSVESRSPPKPQDTAQNVLLAREKQVNLPSSGNSPEPHQTDMEGHYVGPASGVSFLIRVQKRLHEHISFPRTTPIFSFGDAPLPKYDPSFLVIPPKDEAKALLDRYFDFVFPTHRFLHQPQAESWLEDFYRDPGVAQSPKPGAMAIRALLLMIFAHGKQCLPKSDSSLGSCVNSAVYFAASEHHLAAETGPVRLASVQARLAQCFYLLGQSRINHCWSLFGTTARLAIAIGLHRGRRRDVKDNFVEHECSKRVFWCMYSLDNYLSAALGRPRIFHDDEIDQELPAIANDSQITPSGVVPASSNTQSIMLAPVYHAKLSKIISGILRDLYSIRRMTLQSQSAAAAKHGAELAQWRQEISAFVDLANVDMLVLTYQRQYTVLNLAFFHSQILLYRPFILRDFKNLALPASPESNDLAESVSENARHCLEAAMKITSILRDLCENGKMYHSFWFTHYYAFSAIVVFAESYLAYFQAGERAQYDLAASGSQSSFAQRYAMVLEELRKEAQKCIQQKQQLATGYHHSDQVTDSASADMSAQEPNVSRQSFSYEPAVFPQSTFAHTEQAITHSPPLELSNMHPEQQTWIENLIQDSSPRTYIPSFTGWGEFDSLALTGLGELGHIFSSNDLPDFRG